MTVSSLARELVAAGDVIADKYRVDRVLGKGGMGMVVAATHLSLGHPVAIKLMLPEVMGSTMLAQRFQREARAVAQLRSENICHVHDVGNLENGAPYMVMEYLTGRDLYQMLKDGGPLASGDVAEYVMQACEGMAEAHGRGIVHRDLKPHNLFLTQRADGSPLIKVLDFGVAKAEDDLQATTATALLGSPAYMAPEQMRASSSVDARADIYALGAILYTLTTGEIPFKAASLPELCDMVMNQPAAPPSQIRAGLPAALDEVVLRCLAKDPADRFADVGDLARALAPLGPPGAITRAEAARRVLSRGDHTPPPQPLEASGATAPERPSARAMQPPAPEAPRARRVTQPDVATQGAAAPSRQPVPPARARRGKGPIIATVVALAAAGGGAVWWKLGRKVDQRPGMAADPVPRASAPGGEPLVDPSGGWPSTVAPAGRVLSFPEEDVLLHAALSPAADQMAYVKGGSLFLRPAAGGDERAVALDGVVPATVSFAGDGRTLLIGGTTAAGPGLFAVTIDGGATTPLVDGTMVGALSPDGGALAFVTSSGLVVARPPGGEEKLAVTANQDRIAAVAWSPDGGELAYLRVPPPSRGGHQRDGRLETVPAAGGAATLIAKDDPAARFSGAAGQTSLAWTPAGFLYVGWGANGAAIWLRRQDGDRGRLEVKAIPRAEAAWLSASSDGARFLVGSVVSQKDVMVAAIEQDGRALGAPERLTDGKQDDVPSDWTSDGEVLFLSDLATAGVFDLYRRKPGAAGASEIFADGAGKSDLELSPLGDAVLFWRSAGGTAGEVMSVPLGGGTPQRIHAAARPVTLRCVPSGCFLAERTGDNLVVHAFNPDPAFGRGRELARIPVKGHAWDVDPDARTLAAVGPDGVLRTVDLNTSQVTGSAAIDPAWTIQSLVFDSAGKGFFATGARDKGTFAIARVEPDGSSAFLRTSRSWLANPRPSPDGKHLAFQASPVDQALWLIDLPK